MEVALDQLRSPDSYKYLGVSMSITMVTGDVLKGELHCMDLQRGQTLILKPDESDSVSLYILKATSIKKIVAHSKLNESINDIPRLQYNDLAVHKQILNR